MAATDDVELLRARIEALAPDRSRDRASALALSDAGHALTAGFSQALDVPLSGEFPARAELGARCLELVRQWLPLLDRKTLTALEWRVTDRRTPLDLSARKAELRRASGKVKDRSGELAAHRELPPIAGFVPLAALYVEKRLMIGEFPETAKMVPARPGVWLTYAWYKDGPPRPEDDVYPQLLLAVHADRVARVAELRRAAKRLPKELPIHGARVAVADATAAKEEDFVTALAENNAQDFAGRAVQVYLGGDGRAIASVAREDEQVVLAVIDFR